MVDLNPVRGQRDLTEAQRKQTSNGVRVAASWSGGKESSLALYKAMERGYKIKYLLNFISKKYKRCCFHGIQKELINLQADLLDIPLFQKEVSPDMKLYEEEFKEAVSQLKKKKTSPVRNPDKHVSNGVKGMVFGDIYLIDHKNWVERVCKSLKIKMIEPLWSLSPEKIVTEFIRSGFKAVVVSAKAELFDKDFVGREVDFRFLKELKKRKICPCGENGEFHTFVIDGPIFKKGKLEITKSRKILRKGFWPHWFLDIQRWRVKNKQ